MTASRDLFRAALSRQYSFIVRAARHLAVVVGVRQPDRSPESLVILLAKTAERVRTDPGASLSHCAVRWSAEILRARLDERLPDTSGRHPMSMLRRRPVGDWLVVGICVAVGYSAGGRWSRRQSNRGR